jgi:hypothetical protein
MRQVDWDRDCGCGSSSPSRDQAVELMVESRRDSERGDRKLEVATPERQQEEQRRGHGQAMAPAEVERYPVGAALEYETEPRNAAPEHVRAHEI